LNTIKVLSTYILVLSCLFGTSSQLFAQYSDAFICTDSKVRSIQLRTKQQSANPVMNLGGQTDFLELHFDILESNPRDLTYSLVLCNQDWSVNEFLTPSQYLDGFNESNNIDYDFSINTKVNYIHYFIRFPEESMVPTLSGNYLLQVKENDVILFQYPLFVTEQNIDINGALGLTNALSKRQTDHQIQFTVNLGSNFPPSASQEISASIFQNFSKYDVIEHLKPDNFNNTQLNFGFYGNNSLPALNEFRAFDNVDLYNRSIRIFQQNIDGDTVRINLYTDKSLARNNYLTLRDLNGCFVISNRQGISPDTDADYCSVRFTYDSPFMAQQALVLNGKAFDFGTYTLQYIPSEELYYRDILLKQGFYNYRYTSIGPNGNNTQKHEGSYLQSENEYHIVIYRRAFGQQYDQILGIMRLNSANKF
jgi:hypothetical protein